MIPCRDVRARLQDYVDDQLPRRSAMAVYLHLQECDGCAAEERRLRRLIDALAALPQPEPPADFDARILASLPLEHYREMADLRRPRVAVLLEPEFLPAWLRAPLLRGAGIAAAAAGLLVAALGGGAEWRWAVVGLVPELLVRLQALGRRFHVGEPQHHSSS